MRKSGIKQLQVQNFYCLLIDVNLIIDNKILTYRVLLNEEPEGGFTVTVPALPGCVTYGEDLDPDFRKKEVLAI